VSIIGAGMKLAYVVCLWIICLLINRAFECVCVCVCVFVYAGMLVWEFAQALWALHCSVRVVHMCTNVLK
jgi:hypothetical protein